MLNNLFSRVFPFFITVLVGVSLWSNQHYAKERLSISKTESEAHLNLNISSEKDGNLQIYYDFGDDFKEKNSFSYPIYGSPESKIYHFDLPKGIYTRFRIDFSAPTETIVLHDFAILKGRMELLWRANLKGSLSGNQIASIESVDSGLHIRSIAGADDAYVILPLTQPLKLGSFPGDSSLLRHIPTLISIVIASLCGVSIAILWRGMRARSSIFADRPHAFILFIATICVIISCYPVVFFGKSYVSPGNGGVWLLYKDPPFLPGSPSNLHVENVRGSDTGATILQYQQYPFIQAQSISDGEVPLWNRYSSAGVPLFGQGVSMLGDPLHFITIAFSGAAWAWDFKFILAKGVFAVGVGLLALASTRSLIAASALTASAPFLGVFLFRLNHPAYFVTCYAPWLLLGFVMILNARSQLRRWLGGAVVLLATCMEFNTGAVKEGYMVILFSYLFGGFLTLQTALSDKRKFPALIATITVGVCAVLATAIFWLPFYDTLQKSVNYAPSTAPILLPWQLLIGFFEPNFFSAVGQGQIIFPSINPFIGLLAFAGIASAVRWLREPPFTASLLMATGAGLIAFGGVPPALIAKVPLVGEIGHVANVLSLAMVAPTTVLAAYGIRDFAEQAAARRFPWSLVVAAVAVGILVGAYALAMRPGVFDWEQFSRPIIAVEAISLILIACAGYAWFAGVRRRSVAALLGGAMLGAHLWFGLHLSTDVQSLDYWLRAPQARADYSTLSPSLRAVMRPEDPPYRVVGVDGVFFPGYHVAVGLESINGPEPLVVRSYYDLLNALGFEKTFGWGWLRLVMAGDVERLSRALDLLNVRFLLAPKGFSSGEAAGVVRVGESDLSVFERPSAWPRAFFTDRIVRYASPTDFADQLKKGDGRPFAALQADVSLAPTPPKATDGVVIPATNFRLTANSTGFSLDAPGPGMAVLLETTVPGDFKATINGVDAEVLPVNVAFHGVFVPKAGHYEVAITYTPRGWRYGLWLLAVGLALIGGVALTNLHLWRSRGNRMTSEPT